MYAMLLAVSVTLAWDANTEPDIDHYNLKWGFVSGQEDHTINAGIGTTYQITEPWGVGQTVYFVCTAVNISDLESGPSNEVILKVPPWNPNAPGHLRFESLSK